MNSRQYKSFSEYLQESAEVKQLKHLYHPEELIFIQGEDGIKTALDFLKNTANVLHAKQSNVKISRKWDGAPSTVFGHIDGKFFVGSKSVFNKEPKINYTEEDIDRNHGESAGLAAKLKIALQYLRKVTPNNNLIYQGDFLFDDEIKEKKKVNNIDSIVFRPNTITYSVESKSELGKSVSAAKMGIVIHTYYESLDSGAKFLPDLSGFKKSKDCFFVDAEMQTAQNIMFTETEYTSLLKIITDIERIEKTLEGKDFFSKVSPVSALVTTFNNTLIRSNSKLDASKSVDSLIKYVNEKLTKEVNKALSDAGKKKKEAAKSDAIRTISDNRSLFVSAYQMYNLMVEAKDLMIKKFNTMKQFGTFINSGDTYVPSNDEGFVMISDAGVLKLVDRFEFSRINFNLAKTW